MPTNISEGSKRQTKPDYAGFLNIAEGSLAETENLLMLSRDLEYLKAEACGRPLTETSEIARMLYTLRSEWRRFNQPVEGQYAVD